MAGVLNRSAVAGMCFAVFLCAWQQGKAQPPVAGVSQFVDKYTGDLNYSIPLLTVPGPNGEAFPITLQYASGGIGVDQTASEVGLGWSLTVGEIARRMNGHPDDYRGAPVVRNSIGLVEESQNVIDPSLTTPDEDLQVYGPVHFKDVPQVTTTNCTACPSMDIYATQTEENDGSSPFEFPDYDDYVMAGPLLSGALSLRLFDHATIFKKPIIGTGQEAFEYDMGIHYAPVLQRPVMFSPDAASLNIEPALDRDWTSWPDDWHFQDFPFADPSNPTSYGTDLIDQNGTRVVKTGKQVKYFTNKEIADHHSETSLITGFIDWRDPSDYPSRSNTDHFPQHGIGAIQVLAEDGRTFHFSLPVHLRQQTRYTFDINGNITGYQIQEATIKQDLLEEDYAESWKLTAITGPDYVDDGDGLPGQGDRGYWIRFDYAKWADDFSTRFPSFGYEVDMGSRNMISSAQGALLLQSPLYRKTGMVVNQRREIIYLNRIVTTSHSALFIHDIRMDDHSVDEAPIPLLRLARIILVRNSDLNGSTPSPSTSLGLGPFNTPNMGCTPDNVYHVGHLTGGGLMNTSLASVQLDHDYSLSKGYYTNINSGYASSICLGAAASSTSLFVPEPTGVNANHNASSGKLTLKSIKHLGRAGVQTIPDHRFTYYDEIEGDPLHHDHRKKDHFGNYKFNHDPYSRGGYTTTISAARLHAWSLRTITDPLDAVLTVTYEPDDYVRTGYPTNIGTPPTRYYPLINFYRANQSVGTATLDDSDALEEAQAIISGDPRYRSAMLHFLKSCDGEWTYMFTPISFLHPLSGTGPYSLDARKMVGTSGFLWDFCLDPPPNWTDVSREFIKLTYNRQIGGGIRVKEIGLSNSATSAQTKLRLTYSDGVCSAEPDPIDREKPRMHQSNQFTGWDLYLTMERANGDRHAPSPSVGYTLVKEEVIGTDELVGGGVEYEFQNYTKGISYETFSKPNSPVYYKVIECKVHAEKRGRLLRRSVLDKQDNALSSTEYHYSSQPSSSITEAFISGGEYLGTAGSVYVPSWGMFTGAQVRNAYIKKEEHQRLDKITHWDNASETTTEYETFDPNTGEPTSVRITRTGVSDETTTLTPAYASVAALGPRWDDPQNKNILGLTNKSVTSIGTGEEFELASLNPIRTYDPVAGEYSTVMTEGEWLPSKQFSRTGTGPNAVQYLGRSTLYDNSLRPLEHRDMIGTTSATRRSISGEFELIHGTNTNHASITHSSFENDVVLPSGSGDRRWFDGDIRCDVAADIQRVGTQGSLAPHSGISMLRLHAGTMAEFKIEPANLDLDGETLNTGLLDGRTYQVLVWISNTSPANAGIKISLDGTNTVVEVHRNDPSALVVGQWTRLQARVAIPVGYSPLSGGLHVQVTNTLGSHQAYFDDLLVHPIDANVEASVWDEHAGIRIATIGASGFVTKYLHDASGEVIEIQQEFETGIRTIQKSSTHFKRPVE